MRENRTPGSVGGRAGDCSAYRPALAGGGAFSLYQTPPLLAALAALSKRDSQGAVLGAVMARRQPGQHVPPKTFAPRKTSQDRRQRFGWAVAAGRRPGATRPHKPD